MQIRFLQLALALALVTLSHGCERRESSPQNLTSQTPVSQAKPEQIEKMLPVVSLDALLLLLEQPTDIRGLDLQHSKIADQELIHLSKFSQLEELNLPADTSDDGLQHLSGLTNLRKLMQNRTSMETHVLEQISDAGLQHLENLDALETLSLPYAKITDVGLKRLGKYPAIETLHLGCKEITDAGVHHLASLTELRSLSLRGTSVGDAGIELISKNHSRLEQLNLCHTKITSAAVEDLSKLKNLKWLGVYGTPLSGSYPNGSDATAQLKRALPNTEILWID